MYIKYARTPSRPATAADTRPAHYSEWYPSPPPHWKAAVNEVVPMMTNAMADGFRRGSYELQWLVDLLFDALALPESERGYFAEVVYDRACIPKPGDHPPPVDWGCGWYLRDAVEFFYTRLAYDCQDGQLQILCDGTAIDHKRRRGKRRKR